MNSYTQKLLDRADQAMRQGRIDDEAAALAKAAELDPNNPAVFHRAGSHCMRRGMIAEAIAHFMRALQLNPSNDASRFELAHALFLSGQLDHALTLAQQHAHRHATDPRSHVLVAAVLAESGRLDTAEQSLQTALKLAPAHQDALMSLGIIRAKQRRHAEAVELFRQVLSSKPDQPSVLGNLATAYDAAGQFDLAIETYQRALALAPASAALQSNLAALLENSGRTDEALPLYEKVIAAAPENAGLYGNFLAALTRSSSRAPSAVFQAHVDFDARFGARIRPTTSHANDRDPDRPLRIGYVSPDFCSHAVATFFEPLLTHHDRSRFTVTSYSATHLEDDTTRRLRSHAHAWRDIRPMSDSGAAQQVANDQIDILVDLAGHTAGNRLLLFAQKPAPIQVTYLGYPNTTGLRAIDYRLTDPVADPVGMMDEFYTEKLWRLPRSSWCYRPSDHSPEVSALPADANDFITFASFHHLGRLGPPVIALWSQLLLQIPAARLLIARNTLSESARAHFTKEFAGHGVNPSQLLFQTLSPDSAPLLYYNDCDVLLDTFPWSGHTTACDALYMGVPVITLPAQSPASRMVASVLTAVGMPELIAASTDDYIRIARELAADRPRLRTMRQNLRATMKSCPLFDARGLASEVETAYRTMWRSYCARSE